MSFALALNGPAADDILLDSPHAAAINTLNRVLRGELSAVETYEQAFGAFRDRPALLGRLRELRDEHKESVRTLQELILDLGGDPAGDSGVWGSLAAAATGTAKVIGPSTVLYALQQGAEMGTNDYLRVLEEGVPNGARAVIVNRLIPRCEEHVAELSDLRWQLG